MGSLCFQAVSSAGDHHIRSCVGSIVKRRFDARILNAIKQAECATPACACFRARCRDRVMRSQAEQKDVPQNGHWIIEFDFLNGTKSSLDALPTPDQLLARLQAAAGLGDEDTGRLLTPSYQALDAPLPGDRHQPQPAGDPPGAKAHPPVHGHRDRQDRGRLPDLLEALDRALDPRRHGPQAPHPLPGRPQRLSTEPGVREAGARRHPPSLAPRPFEGEERRGPRAYADTGRPPALAQPLSPSCADPRPLYPFSNIDFDLQWRWGGPCSSQAPRPAVASRGG